MQRAFRPTLALTLCVLVALTVLLALGAWQLQRLSWKNNLLSEIQQRQEAEPQALPQAIASDLAYGRYILRGQFLNERSYLLFGRSYQGATGLHVLTPFAMTDGRTVVVDRGWVPTSKSSPSHWPTKTGAVEIVGSLRVLNPQTKSGWLSPHNMEQGEHLFFVEPALIGKRKGLDVEAGFFLEAIEQTQSGEGNLPVPHPSHITIANDHLQYALTWFFFALIVLVIYVLMSLKKTNKQP